MTSSFAKQIGAIRAQEQASIFKAFTLKSINLVCFSCAPYLTSMVVFSVVVLLLSGLPRLLGLVVVLDVVYTLSDPRSRSPRERLKQHKRWHWRLYIHISCIFLLSLSGCRSYHFACISPHLDIIKYDLFISLAQAYLGTHVSVAAVFSALSLIHTLRESVGKNLTFAIETAAESSTAMARLTSFLCLPEIPLSSSHSSIPHSHSAHPITDSTDSKDSTGLPATNTPTNPQQKVSEQAPPSKMLISVKHANFAWGPEKPSLEDLNFSLKAGELLVIAGDTGSGKSTLLQALLGELKNSPNNIMTIVFTLRAMCDV